MENVKIQISRLPTAAGLALPAYQTSHSAGMDLVAAEDAVLAPGGRAGVGTGLCIALPDGYEAQIRPRSGLAIRHGITLVNTPGTIDADYRGEVTVILINHGFRPFRVSRGMRIAQMVIAPVAAVAWEEAARLPETARGKGGFGSTGN